MGAPKGNKYWELREKHGRDKILTPKELLIFAYEYFEYRDSNPIEVDDNKGTKFVNKIKIHLPYTWRDFEVFIFEKTGLSTLEDYKANDDNRYDDFVDIIRIIDNKMYSQKFNGAAIGLFKENLIARELGLAEKKQTEHSGRVKTDIHAINEEEQAKIAELLARFTD